MKTHRFFFWLVSVISAWLTSSANSSAQSYRLDDLGAAALGTNSYALGVNNQGQVVGYWLAPDGAHAFLYHLGKVTDLGSLGGTNNYALSINDGGQVAGFSETGEGLSAFVFQNGKINNLGSLGGVNSYAYGLNKQGQIVGYIDTPMGARAIIYQNGAATDIGTLGGTNSFAFGINSLFQVAGSSLTANNQSLHAFLWQGGSITDLNPLFRQRNGWELSEARGINDRGEIVGWGILNDRERAFLYHDGAVTDLGVIAGGTNSYAFGLNNLVQVVGASSTADGVHAFLWHGGVMTDLNSLIEPMSGWELREARGINDLGQVVGWGVTKGEEHAFLLTPTGASSGSAGSATGQRVRRPLVGGSFTVTITVLATIS